MEELVKAHWITGAPGFLKMHFSEDVAQRLRESLPAETRRSLTELEPIQWCSRDHHVEVMKAIAAQKRAEAEAFQDLSKYGEYVARVRLEGPWRHLLPVLSLKLFAKNLPLIWTREHQDGTSLEVDMAPIEDGRLPWRVLGAKNYDHVGIVALGWVKEIVAQLTSKPVRTRQQGWSLREPGSDEIQCEVSWS